MNKLLVGFIHLCAKLEANPDVVLALLASGEYEQTREEFGDTLDMMHSNAIETMGGFVYQMPILSPAACDSLVYIASSYDFAPNMDEGSEYRIEEAILDRVDTVLYQGLLRELMPTLNAYCLLINSTPITKIESLQLAKYRPEGTPGTGWHHDKTSDFTCVISLNPEAFEGGGTGIRLAPHASFDVPPLEKGWGLIFNGRSIQHRGLPVTSGERLLLVCWCSTREIKDEQ